MISEQTIADNFAKFMRQERHRRRMSAIELAVDMDISVQLLRKIEAGKGDCIKLKFLMKIAAGLGMTMTDLMNQIEDPKPEDNPLRIKLPAKAVKSGIVVYFEDSK